MKVQLKMLLILCLLITLSGCITTDSEESGRNTEKFISKEPEISDGLPLSWIYFKDEKYPFNKVIPKEEVDMSLIESTGTQTKVGDGAKYGQEIYLYKKDDSLFIIDEEGPTEEWANYIKN